jgi:hypothetical protein
VFAQTAALEVQELGEVGALLVAARPSFVGIVKNWGAGVETAVFYKNKNTFFTFLWFFSRKFFSPFSLSLGSNFWPHPLL